ncbi:hypothetical protein PPTG_00125 [Phytophthora nicotianae INRA-310]|uniref:Uncharacterized protein n=1 Tax=Phytophthora nicotianae (strain INRA-310) TaxID=761204 RepID=W2RG67_PHYN3|nr:hypothetical protein PPTG_00125 [Phytophthora nicotianae INRA-310]ETN23545.1 hypothetical protein PPTG_00125 [Phytophthora nicotianae INRA-310]
MNRAQEANAPAKNLQKKWNHTTSTNNAPRPNTCPIRVFAKDLLVHSRWFSDVKVQGQYCNYSARLTATVCRVLGNHYEIVLRNQNYTHSHSNSETQASSYLTTATLPLDNQGLEDVKTLADARVSSTHITNFLNDRIG